MLEFFRTNQFFYSLLLLPYAAIIRIYSLINPSSYEMDDRTSGLFECIYRPIENLPLLQSILSILLIYVQAMFINQLISNNRMSKVNTLFPGLFFILFTSLSIPFLSFAPILIGNLFFIIGLFNIFGIYKNPKSAGKVFNFGFFIALSALFYFPFVLFLIVGLIAIGSLKALKLVDVLQFLIGAITCILIFSTAFFYFDLLPELWNHAILIIDLNPFVQWMTIPWIALTFFLCYVMIQVFNYSSFIKKMSIQIHKKFDILYWVLLIGSLSFICVHPLALNHYLIAAVPIAILTGLSVERIKNRMLGEVLHIGIILAIFFFEFNKFF